MATIEEAFDIALQHYRTGRLDQCEAVCRQVLQFVPDQSDCLHLLAVLEHSAGHHEPALGLLEHAIRAQDTNPTFFITLGMTHRALGSRDLAARAYRRALDLDPNLPEALSNLCHVLCDMGQHEEAVRLGRRAVELRPDFAAAHNNLANALKSLGSLDDAMEHYEYALRADPNHAEAYSNLGNAFAARNDLDDAIICHREAIRIRPGFAAAYCGLGHAQYRKNHVDEALESFQKVLEIDPAHTDAQLSIINILRDQGKLMLVESAVDGLRRLLARDPDNEDIHRNLLFTLNYQPGADPHLVCQEHRRWARKHEHLSATATHGNDPDPARRLRIAYVSPDFRNHAVAYFLRPLFEHHDPARVEIFSYAQVEKPDHVTAWFQERSAHWRNTVPQDDARVAEAIREDRIDIAVDLAGHTRGNRLLALARKPAPVQATYLGYPMTTGLSALDYRISDAVADPSESPTPGAESIVRLPCGATCYAPPPDAPAVTPLPALGPDRRGAVTFGSLSNPAKINHQVISLWSRVLLAVPGSRLCIARETIRGQFLEDFLANFLQQGVRPDQIQLRSTLEPHQRPIHRYQEFDIALDTFPYASHTTACESIWMGVPMVTVRGRTLGARMAASVLTQAGLGDLVADTPDAFVRIARTLASDLDALGTMRANLRARVAASPLCDGAGFTHELEKAYRWMWQQWCQHRAAA